MPSCGGTMVRNDSSNPRMSWLMACLHRQTRDTTTGIHICTRHERPRRTLPLHHALRARGVLLLCEVYRRELSVIRPANARGCTSGAQGNFGVSLSFSACLTHLQLLDRCLKIVDPELFTHLRSKNLSAEIYAFPCTSLSWPFYSEFLRSLYYVTAILTLCACTPPLDQVLLLWDFLLAFGVHLNVLCVIAQLLLMREEVMASSRCVS